MSSCFVEKLNHHLLLTDAEKRALAVLEDNPEPLDAGKTLVEEGDSGDGLYVLREGLLLSASLLKGGERQILRIYHSGDLVGTTGIPWRRAPASATAIVDSVVCHFPRAALREIFIAHPRLAALFYSIGMIENVALSDRLKSLGRTEGKARVAAFLLEMLGRLRITDRNVTNRYDLRLTQADIGDAVGLTPVHVNRMLRELTEEGCILRDGRSIAIADEQQLAEYCEFIDRYRDIDTSWFPPASA
ncbi:MAG: transcriptional regulator [Sphingomonas sanxanigenens]|uniref:Transcriptional regulator n=1 Tax=Sphingomonas sanxanigenens TaxID=397260 RepID=A0A2W5AET2_9SPHN|nr:MAG: transcriptional regulator [Sphingomonas sanxanigenens]